MSILKIVKRLVFYPLGILKGIHQLGVNHSRDIYNKRRFKKSIIDKECSIDEYSKIDAFSHILSNTIINKSTIRSYSYVGRNCIVQNATIGKFCSIANDVFLGLGKHPIENFSTSPLFYRKKNTLKIDLVDTDLDFDEYENIIVGNDVWIGARAIIMDGVKINNGAIVAANSVVTKDVPAYAIVGGVPAKILKYRFNEKKIETLLNTEWWDDDLQTIKSKINNLNRL
mgnify:CR=1 FL=1|tara:strand:- start:2426 stop:3106 length:681 start_codon:yes stop_codon:yes gene_type:complete